MPLKLALGQINCCVGDIGGNCRKILDTYCRAKEKGAGLIVFPEMCISGYPPEDLLHKPHFIEDCRDGIESVAANITGNAAIIGFPEYQAGKVFNSLAVIKDGRIEHFYRKIHLPNYEVFDEIRYFTPGKNILTIEISGFKVTLTICEDIWIEDWLEDFTAAGPRTDLLINIAASPFNAGKVDQRREILTRCTKKLNCALAYCNLVGGQDELVFDGRSSFLDSDGNIVSEAKSFDEDLLFADIVKLKDSKEIAINCNGQSNKAAEIRGNRQDELNDILSALVTGTRDYVRKNGFNKALIGISGGIDSAITAVIAAEALGPKNVIGVTMPTRFNTSETIKDSKKLGANLGIDFHNIAIAGVLNSFDETLKTIQGWDNKGVAFENLQARIRGMLLMSLSNQFGALVLTTGNKSETAVGYTTLYGDTAGGFAVIKDVPKTVVFELCEFYNKLKGREVIPTSIIARPPSAELREDQRDTDSLPDYAVLDEILNGYIEKDLSAGQLIEKGMDEKTVRKVISMVDRNEYKRRQSPPGVRITPKAFGKDRRMPITNRYKPS
jgi:NAD+ synthase (glutamine-hydrolysing)